MRSGPLALPSTLPDLTPAHLLATVLPAFHAPQASSHGIPARTSPPAASFPSCPSESFFPPSYPGGIRCGLSLFFSQRQPVALNCISSVSLRSLPRCHWGLPSPTVCHTYFTVLFSFLSEKMCERYSYTKFSPSLVSHSLLQ